MPSPGASESFSMSLLLCGPSYQAAVSAEGAGLVLYCSEGVCQLGKDFDKREKENPAKEMN
jgi:hypothetical protein